jgi:hypothetical protein
MHWKRFQCKLSGKAQADPLTDGTSKVEPPESGVTSQKTLKNKMFLFWFRPSAEGLRINQQALYFLPNGKEEAGFRLICHSFGVVNARRETIRSNFNFRTKLLKLMNTLKKFVASSVVVTTVLSLVVAVAPVKAAVATAGDLIKQSGNSSVYYLGSDSKRYVFPNEATYKSWYNDFSMVKVIPQAELEGYGIGGNVTIRPGTKLVKITTNPKVYAVEPGGVLKAIPDEATAKTLYGADWAKRVVDVPDAFFINYKDSGASVSAGAYPAGSLVKFTASSPDVYYINADGTASKIADESAFTASRFQFANVLDGSAVTMPATGAAITGATATDLTSGAGTVVYTGGSGVTVALAGTTAASNTIVSSQATANLASFNFTAASDGAVKVTSVKLKRLGISGDSALVNVYLYDGNVRLTDGSTFSNGVVSFSDGAGLFSIPAGQTKTITVKADVADPATVSSGTVGVGIVAATDVVAGGASVAGSFPAAGNLMSISKPDAATLGTASVAVPTSVGATVNAGTNNVVLWSSQVTASVKYSNLQGLTLKQIGSAQFDAVQNFKLYVDGVQAGSALAMATADGTVVFDLAATAPKLEVGNHTVEVRGDVVKGSSRNFLYSLQTASDIVILESGYGINVTPTIVGGAPAKPVAATQINAGTLSVSTDTTLNATQVVKGSSNLTLARYSIKAYGEDMKVQTLTVVPAFTGFASTSEGLSNLSVFVNGSQVGSSKNYLATTNGAAAAAFAAATLPVYGTTNLFTIPAGQTVTVEIRGDLTQNATSYLATVDANLRIVAGAAQGVASAQTWPTVAQGTQNYAGQNALSIVTGALTLSKSSSFASQNVLANTQKVKIGSYIVQAGNAEDVNVTSLGVALSGDASVNDLTNLYVVYGGTTADPVVPAATNNFTANMTVPANGYKTVDVYADLGSNLADGTTTITTLTVNYRGAKTNTSNVGTVAGQTMTVRTGTLTTPTLVSNNPVPKLVAGGATDVIANYKFVANNGTATIQEVWFKIFGSTANSATTTPNGSSLASVKVDGRDATIVQIGSEFYAKVTGLAYAITPGSAGVNVPVTVTYNNVTSAGNGGETTRTYVGLNLVYFKYQIANTVAEVNTNVASNAMLLVASVPTFATSPVNPAGVSSGFAASNDKAVLAFTVTAPANQPINLKALSFTPSISGALTSAATQLIKVYDYDNQTIVLGTSTNMANGVENKVTFNQEFTISGGTTKTFLVKADLAGLTTTGNSFELDLTNTGAGAMEWNDTTVTGVYGDGTLVQKLPIYGNMFVK